MTLKTGLAMVWLCSAAPLAAILIPLLLPVLQQDAGLGPKETGFLAAADLVGSCVPTLTAPFWLARTGSRRGAAIGLAVIVVANAFAAVARIAWLLLALRVLSGIGLGLVLSSAVPLVADSAKPARLISATQVLQLLLAAAAFGGAGWVLPRIGAQGVLLMVAAATLAGTPLVFFLPNKRTSARTLPTFGEMRPGAPVLLAILIYFASVAVLTNFAGKLGIQRSFSLSLVSTALATGNLGALPGSLVAMTVSRQTARARLLIGTTLVECVAIAAMLWVPGALVFVVGFFLIQVCVTALAPLQVAILVDRDPGGRGIEGLAAVQIIGQAVGPIFGGLFITAARVDGAYLFGLICVVISVALIHWPAVLTTRFTRR